MNYYSFLTMNICLPYWIVILILSVIQQVVFWIWKSDIFDWNPELKYMHPVVRTSKKKSPYFDKNNWQIKWKNRKDTYKNAPVAWKLYRFVLEFLGVFIGWNLISTFVIIFLNRDLNLDTSDSWSLLLLLIIGLIGISGRLPVIIDSVQDWFKK